ncbi:MAG: DUF424 domain-containing protein [Archaeoglobales archaeon]|jgi:hypothetical protein|nr:DUF424 domain-containing protein [Archaeoglobi archaeon]NHW23875.1 DUF424 domain-containing protein [Archaeoglobales archaeon]TDA28787.1 MAG: DUF424 domain-containing protein [Archaeoglobi archaeon]TDA30628.1 MAG: DUF424 domain-containing protein [Archaeoglobi archaeon]
MKFRMKIYRVRGEVLVAVCDSELVGKTFREGNLKIEVKEDFYGTEDFDEKEVEEALKRATIANITGKRAVELAIRIGIVDRERVLRIGDCLHAQMVLM